MNLNVELVVGFGVFSVFTIIPSLLVVVTAPYVSPLSVFGGTLILLIIAQKLFARSVTNSSYSRVISIDKLKYADEYVEGTYELRVGDYNRSFAKPKNIICLQSRLLTDTRKLEAIIAHEAYHLKDSLSMVPILLRNIAILLPAIIVAYGVESKMARNYLIILFILTLGGSFLLNEIANRVSKQREYRADEKAAELVGWKGMATALTRCPYHSSKEEILSTAAKMESNAPIFSSHPSIEDRIRNIMPESPDVEN